MNSTCQYHSGGIDQSDLLVHRVPFGEALSAFNATDWVFLNVVNNFERKQKQS